MLIGVAVEMPSMSNDYTMIHVPDTDPEPSAASGTLNVNLVDLLECTEMRPRVWYLSPGDAMSHHRQAEQEEFYYVLEGPGQILIDGETHTVPEGTAIRIPPDTPRQIRNDTDRDHAWLVVGAPPVEDDGIVLTDD